MSGTNVGTATGYLDLDISGFLSGLRTANEEANRQTSNMATKIGGNLTSIGNKLTSAGTTLTKNVTVPIVGIGTAAVKVSSDFESAMSKVAAISGATGSDLDKLNQKAQEMGAKTKFSATESAQAFEYMAMAGWKTEDMLDGIEGIMNLAAASGEDLATTSDIVTDAITAFGLSAKDSGSFADILAAASSNANTNVSMLGESFKYVAPVAGALGYSAEDTAVALGLMANAGIKSSQAGTAMRSALSRLVKPTDQVAAAMDKYNISLTNSDGTMKPLSQVMDELRTNLGGLTEAEQAQAAATLFGQEAMSGMLAIVNASESDYNKLTDAINNADGTAKSMADTMNDNLAGQITLLKSALEGVAIQLGEILLPHLKNFVAWLQELTAKFAALSPEQKEQIVKWAAIAAAIGPVLVVVGKVVTSVGGMITTFGKIPALLAKAKTAFSAIGTAIGGISAPVVAVVAVIAVLIAAFKHLWDTNEEFRNKITAIWEGIKQKFEDFGKGIVDRLNSLGFDFENFTEVLSAVWNEFCNLLAPLFEGVFNNISIILGTVLDVLTGIFDVFAGIFTGDWDRVWTGIKEIFEGLWNGLVSWFENILNTLKGVADVVLGWFGTSWNELWSSVKQFFVDVWNSIVSFFTNIITTIKTAVSNFITSIINFFKELPTNIKNFITDAWNAVVKWATDMVNKAREMGKSFLNAVVEFFTQLPYKIGYFIGSALGNIVKWVSDMVNKAKELGQQFLSTIVSFFTQLPGKIKEFVTSALENVKQWATNMVDKAKEMAQNFLNNVVSFFTQLPGKVKSFLDSAISNVKQWASDMANKAKEAATNFLNNVVTTITELPGKIKTYLDQAISKLTSWVTDMGNKGKEAITSLINGVKNAASNIASQVASIGSDIVSGVWNGIVSAKNTFVNNVKSFFSGIVDGVKDALGIGSPSKVFAKEVGQWLPPGVAQGFEAALPAAMKQIENDLDKSIDKLDTNDIEVGLTAENGGFFDTAKKTFTQFAVFFESIEDRMIRSLDNMAEKLKELNALGNVVLNPDGTLGYIGYNGFSPQRSRSGYDEDNSRNERQTGGDTFNFYSPKAINEVEAARQMKKAKRDMAEGF